MVCYFSFSSDDTEPLSEWSVRRGSSIVREFRPYYSQDSCWSAVHVSPVSLGLPHGHHIDHCLRTTRITAQPDAAPTTGTFGPLESAGAIVGSPVAAGGWQCLCLQTKVTYLPISIQNSKFAFNNVSLRIVCCSICFVCVSAKGWIGTGGGTPAPPPPPPAGSMPSYCLPDGKCQLQWHL